MADPTAAPDIMAIVAYYLPHVASLGIAPVLYGLKQVYNLAVDIRDQLKENNMLLAEANKQRATTARVLETKP